MNRLFLIVPVYRVEEYLERCVQSAVCQIYPAVEVILVDDGSPDRCPALCDAYARRYPQVHAVHKPNGGLSDARNAGLRFALERAKETDYIGFLDSDDFLHPDYAARLIGLCEEKDCEIAQCGYEKGSGDTFSAARAAGASEVMDAREALLGYALKSQSWAKVYRVSVFAGLSFPRDRYNEDEFVTYRAVWRAARIAFTEEKLYYYYQRSTSIMDTIARSMKENVHSRDFLLAYAERIRFFEERQEWDQVMRTKEKICTDLILRYCEQKNLPKERQEEACQDGTYLRIYRENFRQMIGRRGMPLRRRAMYACFYAAPYSAVLVSRIRPLRK